ncbi:MAG TPA: hypothetical protein VK698_20090 [Kofleriaceae bacterium]|nr:hypothetical protein [Kofleriaceae bacterium]
MFQLETRFAHGGWTHSLQNDLVEELYLHVFPLAFGGGKSLFPATGIDRAFALAKAKPCPTGVVLLHYTRAPAR